MPLNNLYKMFINTVTIATQKLLKYCQTDQQTSNKQSQNNKSVMNKKTNYANVKTNANSASVLQD